MKTIISICFILIAVNAKAGLFDTPLPICTNFKSYQAYEMAKAIKSQCDQQGVVMTIEDLHKTFLSMMTDEYASVSECNKVCGLLNSTSGISMGDCVKNNLVSRFVNGALTSGEFNKSTCSNIRDRSGDFL
jgi:hypothetical protein